MYSPNERQIMADFRLVASLHPSEDSLERALRNVRTSLATQTRIRRPAWLRSLVTAGGIAASVALLITVIMLTFSGPRVNAAGEFERVARINAQYQGWIEVTSIQDSRTASVTYYNTTDGTFARIRFNAEGKPWTYEYDRVAEGEQWTYVRGANQIVVGSLPPKELADFAAKVTETVRIDGFLAMATASLTQVSQATEASLQVDKSREGNLNRYGIAWSGPVDGTYSRTTVLVDPDTMLVEKKTTVCRNMTFEDVYQYRDRDISDIYALGVPENLEVVDLRGADNAEAYADMAVIGSPVPTVRPAQFGRDDLLRIAENARSSIQDLRVTFTYNTHREHARNLMNFYRATVVTEGRKLYVDRKYAAKAEDQPWHRTVAFNGQWVTRVEVDRNRAGISEMTGQDTQTKGLGFFDANLLNLPADDGNGHTDQSLISLLGSRQARVRDQLEMVAGRLCHVVDTSGLSVWLDAEWGCVPMLQIYHDPSGGDVAQMGFIADETAQVGSGLWFVTRARKIVSPSMGSPEMAGGFERTMAVDGWQTGEPAIEINTGVDDDFFDLWKRLPADTKVLNEITGESWIVPAEPPQP